MSGMDWCASLAHVDEAEGTRFLGRLLACGAAHVARPHEPVRHARDLAARWEAHLWEAGRATLFGVRQAGHEAGAAVLCVVPADRKISAPRLRDVLDIDEVRVLRGDRGVGRLGWAGMAGDPGALPGVPAVYRALCLVDDRVMALERLIVALGGALSVALSPSDYVVMTGARVASFTGTTRLRPEGGMVNDP